MAVATGRAYLNILTQRKLVDTARTELNRLVMLTQLTRWGMRPVAAGSAAEAMEVLTRRAAPAGGYDLAVVDMHMPDVDGIAHYMFGE